MKQLMVTVLAGALVLAAQQINNVEKSLSCDSRGDSRHARSCEIREFPVSAAAKLTVDGRTNGGVSLKGWDRADMLVRARVEAWSNSEADAQALAKQIAIQTGATVRADAPDFGRDRGWSVSYEIFVPHRTSATVKAHNGGIAVSDLTGDLDLETVNGGLALARLAGNVKGKTINGGIKADLAGNRWEGGELNVSTTNGGIALQAPAGYSARLEARTVNGGIASDFAASAKRERELNTTIGSGGALIRAVTTNGGIAIKRKG